MIYLHSRVLKKVKSQFRLFGKLRLVQINHKLNSKLKNSKLKSVGKTKQSRNYFKMLLSDVIVVLVGLISQSIELGWLDCADRGALLVCLCFGTAAVVPFPFFQTDPFDNRAMTQDRSDRHI